uniref:Ubiquitin-like protease family profile domain-containing protein n=1 Tax=viral metagenome TaxID=1070528 RepID=A0A6C0J4E8_9ZZZZ
MDNKCAPGNKYQKGSCYTLENLINIAIAFNKNYPNDKIILKSDKKYLLKSLSINMKNKFNCNNQMCWLKTKLLKNMDNENINFFTFRPNGPEKRSEWLSTNDINHVVYQYEKIYDNFNFFGAVPYDFQDLPILDVYNVNFNNLLNNNKSRIGLVINLDKHTESGSHWVSLYSDFKKNQIYFFDSFAKKPGKEIKTFLGQILNFLYEKKYNKTLKEEMIFTKDPSLESFDVRYNKIRHQFKSSDCGVYSINFILRLLKGESFDYITKNITKDDDMNECRKVYFSNVK